MDLLPELFDIVFNHIDKIKDRKALLFTCKKYYNQYKKLMVDIKYVVFFVEDDGRYQPKYDFNGVFGSIPACKKFIKNEQKIKPCKRPAFKGMTIENNFTLFARRDEMCKYRYGGYFSKGYIIEEIEIIK